MSWFSNTFDVMRHGVGALDEAELLDVFFNGRPCSASVEANAAAAKEERSRIFGILVKQWRTRIKYGGKVYEVVATAVETPPT